MKQLPIGTRIQGQTGVLVIVGFYNEIYDICDEGEKHKMFIQDIAFWSAIESGKWVIIK